MTNTRSIARSKKTSFTVGEILIKEGLSAIVPGGGMIYDTTKALINHGKNYFSDRTAARLEDFHRALLLGVNDGKDLEEFSKQEFDADDYYALLSACTQDVESEKTAYYSRLMRTLIGPEISPETRRHFIMSLKDLSHMQVQLLRKIFVNGKYDLMTPGGVNEQLKSLFNDQAPLHRLALSKLASHYFTDNAAHKLTNLGEMFVASIFTIDELTPEGIGKKPFSGTNCTIICSKLDGEFTHKIANAIQDILWAKQIKCSIIGATDRLDNFLLLNRVGIFLCNEQTIANRPLSALERFSTRTPLFRVNLNESYCDAQLDNVKFADTINLNSPHVAQSIKILEEYISKTLIE